MKKEPEKFMTAKEFAAKLGRPYSTIAYWLRENRIPGATTTTIGDAVFWQIPISALAEFREPTIGRPKGSKNRPKEKKGKK
jgi:hypothetical protein